MTHQVAKWYLPPDCLYTKFFAHACSPLMQILCLLSYLQCVVYFVTHSLVSLCAAWGICPPDCCPQRTPRRGQIPQTNVSRLRHGEWSRPLHWIPFWQGKSEPSLFCTLYLCLSAWAHHLLLSHSLSRCQHTASVGPGVHTVTYSCLQVPVPQLQRAKCIPTCVVNLDLVMQTCRQSFRQLVICN